MINRTTSVQSMAPKTVTIAYLILVHRFPEQFKRLFKAIYHPENHYLIHLDKKTSWDVEKDITLFLKNFPNTYMLQSENVVWGGYSMVQAELNGMKYLLNLNIHWDFFINLSGQDFPLKSQKIIREYLSNYLDINFIKIDNQVKERPETMSRIENFHEEDGIGFTDITYKRDYLLNVTPYIGGQWMILTKKCCEFICQSDEVAKFANYYTNTLIADESFFQTLLMNSSFDGKFINNDKRAIIWIPDGKIKLRPKTFTLSDFRFLMEGNHLFARKFDDQIDGQIIDKMKTFFNFPLSNSLNKHKETKVSFASC